MKTYVLQRENLHRFFSSRLGSKEAAEDVVQDIGIKVHELDGRFTTQVENHSAFIYRIGCNLMLDRLKQQRRAAARDQAWSRTQLTEHLGVHVADEPSAEAALGARQRVQRILTIVDRLSPQCRRAFHLHKLEGLTQTEVAQAMGISRSAVEKHISHALKVLLNQLAEEAD